MNNEAMRITCLMFRFDLEAFDKWLEGLDDGPAKRELTDRRQRLADWFGKQSAFRLNAEDEESCAVLKRHIEFLKIQYAYLRRQDALLPAHRKERNRIDNLPTADKRYARWRELADEIRKTKPYIKSKVEIARMVRRHLKNSHDPGDRKIALSVEAIRKAI